MPFLIWNIEKCQLSLQILSEWTHSLSASASLLPHTHIHRHTQNTHTDTQRHTQSHTAILLFHLLSLLRGRASRRMEWRSQVRSDRELGLVGMQKKRIHLATNSLCWVNGPKTAPCPHPLLNRNEGQLTADQRHVVPASGMSSSPTPRRLCCGFRQIPSPACRFSSSVKCVLSYWLVSQGNNVIY